MKYLKYLISIVLLLMGTAACTRNSRSRAATEAAATPNPAEAAAATPIISSTATLTAADLPKSTGRDFVLVIDRSESMGALILNSDGSFSEYPRPSKDLDPVLCNSKTPLMAPDGAQAQWTGDCHPFHEVKTAAFSFVEKFMDPARDRVAIVVFDNQAYPVNFGTADAPVYLSGDRAAVEDAIRHLWIYDGFHDTGAGADKRQPNVYNDTLHGMECPYLEGAKIPAGTPPCRLKNSIGEYYSLDCAGFYTDPMDGSRCGTTNIGQGLQWATYILASNNHPIRPVTVLLTDGVPNAAYDANSMPICPEYTRVRPPFCRDTNSSARHAATDTALYDADDFARDQADTLATGSLIFSIGLGNKITDNELSEPGTEPPGQALLNYIAGVGQTDTYYQAATPLSLQSALQAIGEKLGTSATTP